MEHDLILMHVSMDLNYLIIVLDFDVEFDPKIFLTT